MFQLKSSFLLALLCTTIASSQSTFLDKSDFSLLAFAEKFVNDEEINFLEENLEIIAKELDSNLIYLGESIAEVDLIFLDESNYPIFYRDSTVLIDKSYIRDRFISVIEKEEVFSSFFREISYDRARNKKERKKAMYGEFNHIFLKTYLTIFFDLAHEHSHDAARRFLNMLRNNNFEHGVTVQEKISNNEVYYLFEDREELFCDFLAGVAFNEAFKTRLRFNEKITPKESLMADVTNYVFQLGDVKNSSKHSEFHKRLSSFFMGLYYTKSEDYYGYAKFIGAGLLAICLLPQNELEVPERCWELINRMN